MHNIDVIEPALMNNGLCQYFYQTWNKGEKKTEKHSVFHLAILYFHCLTTVCIMFSPFVAWLW